MNRDDASTAGPASPLEGIAAWLEYSGFALRRVHAGHYVFRHTTRGDVVTVPAAPHPAAVARLMRECERHTGA